MPQLARRLRPPRKTAELPAADSKQSILYPLDLAYARSGLESPHARVLSASEIPPPYRSLLAHEQAMTLTLERHFRARVVLRALSTFAQGRCTPDACCWCARIRDAPSKWAPSG